VIDLRPTAGRAVALLGAIGSVALATVVVATLEEAASVRDASSVYLVAVVATAIAWGTGGAVVAALASVMGYNFLFTEPRQTLVVSDPSDWLDLVLLLFVAITVGQLAALQRRRAKAALAREREARALFHVSRTLATRGSTADMLPAIARSLMAETGMDRVWIALGPGDAGERPVADTADGSPPPPGGVTTVLRRMPGDEPAVWVRVHDVSVRRGGRGDAPGAVRHRVRIEAGGVALGSIWASRSRGAGTPDRTATRLLAVAADQLGQALAQDRLARELREAEIARQSDALKSALLESVSHDLRTPLAAIRAAAGSLMDPDVELAPDDARASAAAIDREAERLNRVVTNLLDLGRIEGGALRASHDVVDLEDAVGLAVERVRASDGGAAIEVDVAPSSDVDADPVLVDEVLLNLLDNAVTHTARGTPIRVRTTVLPGEALVRLTVEDGGAGVSDEGMSRLFDKFYRASIPGARSRRGTGLGLAVVRGLVLAMNGRVLARRSELGGLAIDIDLPVARVPAGMAAD
jgi:two-component system sensor histidine kinase KdpD